MIKIFEVPFLQELLEKDIPMKVTSLGIILEGFYKSDSVVLNVVKTSYGGYRIIATSRYNETREIECFYDLVELNYDWWNWSKDRNPSWKEYDPIWSQHIKDFLEEK